MSLTRVACINIGRRLLLYCGQLTGGYTTEENDFLPGNNQQLSTVPWEKMKPHNRMLTGPNLVKELFK